MDSQVALHADVDMRQSDLLGFIHSYFIQLAVQVVLSMWTEGWAY